MDMRKLAGGNTSRLRKEEDLTQEQLTERSGLCQQYITGLENGQHNPTILILHELLSLWVSVT